MTDKPLPALSDQIDAITREIPLVHQHKEGFFTAGNIFLQQAGLRAAVRSLEYLSANRDWIIAEARARKERA